MSGFFASLLGETPKPKPTAPPASSKPTQQQQSTPPAPAPPTASATPAVGGSTPVSGGQQNSTPAGSVPVTAPPAPAVTPGLPYTDAAKRLSQSERRDAHVLSADLQSWGSHLFDHTDVIGTEIETFITNMDRPRRDLSLEGPNVLTHATTVNDKLRDLKGKIEPAVPTINKHLTASIDLLKAQITRGAEKEKRRDAGREVARDSLNKLRSTLISELAASKQLMNTQHNKQLSAIHIKHGRLPPTGPNTPSFPLAMPTAAQIAAHNAAPAPPQPAGTLQVATPIGGAAKSSPKPTVTATATGSAAPPTNSVSAAPPPTATAAPATDSGAAGGDDESADGVSGGHELP